MIDDRTVLAIVPARGGSRHPLKNLHEVGSRSLFERLGNLVREAREINRAVLSTRIAHAARTQAST